MIVYKKYLPLVRYWLHRAKPCKKDDIDKCQIFKTIYTSSQPITAAQMADVKKEQLRMIVLTLIYGVSQIVIHPMYGKIVSFDGFYKHYGREPVANKDAKRCELFYHLLFEPFNGRDGFLNYSYCLTTMIYPEWE